MIKPEGWEPYKVVLQRQVPTEVGTPIPMKVFETNQPKNCGDPWLGAYSKHGFWYKFSYGDQNDYDKAMALSFERDSYFMNYESFCIWQKIFQNNFQLIVAKNLKDDLLGSVAYGCYDNYAVIGIYYVVEEHRHSGIGEKLFQEILKNLSGKTIIFHAMSHLKDKCNRFGLGIAPTNWRFIHYTLQNPSGYLDLQQLQSYEICVKQFTELDEAQLKALKCFDKRICGFSRDLWITEWLQHPESQTFVAFNADDEVVGYGNVREVSGNYLKRLLVAPLYSVSTVATKTLLYHLFKKFYNPEEDYEWDPDVFAIYRRNVHFMIPEENQAMLEILNVFKGETGTLRKQRLYYETRCSGSPPEVSMENVYAASDLHLSII